MRSVYENVELIREKRGITKKKLAENAGISQMACSRVLSGESKICADLLKNFAFTLGINDMNIFFNDELTDSVIERCSTL
ncbi:helix-turn-helix transcriptional regulator [Enterocloster asparagiformis]|uniref:helix-turn-helix domain-containing protein n=1 Tax=Enterocloster asparagiformis TaxID=333367 RepID=UPI002A83C77B|nr:helix-turn-helix transcriptional regulator [Enterocloster asparagiformis]